VGYLFVCRADSCHFDPLILLEEAGSAELNS